MCVLLIGEPGIREIITSLFDEYIIDAFKQTGLLKKIAINIARIGIVLTALRLFMNESYKTKVFTYFKFIPLLVLLFKYEIIITSIFKFYSMVGQSFRANDITWDQVYEKLNYSRHVQDATEDEYSFGILNITWDELRTKIMVDSVKLIIYVIRALSTAIFVGIKAMSLIYIYVLLVFGPLNIGLSFVPAFSGMWKAWLQKFMSVCLWIPMLYLIDSFMLGIVDKLASGILNSGMVDLTPYFMTSLLLIMNTWVSLKAPNLSNFIVQGMNVGASQLKDKPKHTGKKLANVVMDAKSGGTSAAARTLLK